MFKSDDHLVYSATDLVAFLECEHLTNLERAAVWGHLDRPTRPDPVLDRIAQRGEQHEARFLTSLQSEALSIVEVRPDEEASFRERVAQGREATLSAMREGTDVIYQAVLFDGRRLGYADFLVRVEQASDLGSWGYEVWDTKLARYAKASAVLQTCMYSDMVGGLQGRLPENMHLALGGVQAEKVSFRVADYAAYYRMVAREFEAALHGTPAYPVETVPEPVEHCDICRWSLQCRDEWRANDDLSLVAGLSSRQRRALHEVGITTRTGLAEPAEPLADRLDGAGWDALARIRAQAEIQVRGERAGAVLSERIPPPRDRDGALVPNQGLLMLPEPSPGDLFFDIEGDPFFGSDEVDGIEYLFGVIEPGRTDAAGQPSFHSFWSIEHGTVTTNGERRAFEAFIDLVVDRLESDPDLHVYHYAPYEPTAVKRLAGRYGTREEEVDSLLRGGVFVDLYRAVRQGVRASVESYSIKRLEPLYDFRREIGLRDAGRYAEQISKLEQGDMDDPDYIDDDDGLDVGGFKFGLEAQLQEALSDNMQHLEPGLVLDETEKSVQAGRIDIAATDAQGRIVIIELKAGTAKPDSITQLLGYMGTVENPDSREVRGILVAHDFDPKVRYAANALPNVELKAYRFRFDFTDI